MLAASVAIAALTALLATLRWAGPGGAQIGVQLPDSAMRPAKITPQALQLWRVAILRAAGVKPSALGPRTGREWQENSSSTFFVVATTAL